MSKSLIKLIDIALIPASLMIIAKFLGVILTVKLFDINWQMNQYSSKVFSFGSELNSNDLRTVTSYSDMLMYLALAVFFSVTIIRAIYLHNTHVKPALFSKLANRNMLTLIKSSYDIYHSGSIALLFTVIANLVIIVNTLNERTYVWIAVASTLTTIVLTVTFLQDIYREIENIKQNPHKYTWI